MTQLFPFDIAKATAKIKQTILGDVDCPYTEPGVWDAIMKLPSTDKLFDGTGIFPWTPSFYVGSKDVNILEDISVRDFQFYLNHQLQLATVFFPSEQTVIPNDDDPQRVKVEMYHNGISVLSHPNKDGYYKRETLVDFCGEQTIRYREDPDGVESCEQEFKIVASL